MSSNYPINYTWAENSSNRGTITEEEFGIGINYQGAIISSQLNSVSNLITQSVKFLQNSGGYWSGSKNYVVGDFVSILFKSSVFNQIFIRYFRCTADNSNQHPLKSSIINKAGDIPVYTGGSVNSDYWEAASLNWDELSNRFVTRYTEQSDITAKKTFILTEASHEREFVSLKQTSDSTDTLQSSIILNSSGGTQAKPIITLRGTPDGNNFSQLNIPSGIIENNSTDPLDYPALVSTTGVDTGGALGKYQGIYISKRASSQNGFTMAVNCTNSTYTKGSTSNEILTHKDLTNYLQTNPVNQFTRAISNNPYWSTYNSTCPVPNQVPQWGRYYLYYADPSKSKRSALPSIITTSGATLCAFNIGVIDPYDDIAFYIWADATTKKMYSFCGGMDSGGLSEVFSAFSIMPVNYYYTWGYSTTWSKNYFNFPNTEVSIIGATFFY